MPERLNDYETLLTANQIFINRTKNVAVISAEDAINWSLTGPMLRGSGVKHDLRKAEPYSGYEKFDFEIAYGTNGDAYDRYLLRLEEIRQSLRIVKQAIDGMPEGPVSRACSGRGAAAQGRCAAQDGIDDFPFQDHHRRIQRAERRSVPGDRVAQGRAWILYRRRWQSNGTDEFGSGRRRSSIWPVCRRWSKDSCSPTWLSRSAPLILCLERLTDDSDQRVGRADAGEGGANIRGGSRPFSRR